MDLNAVESAAAFHKMDALAAYALVDAGVQSAFCTEAVDGETRREILFDLERQKVYQALENAGIWYVPLKGAVLKDVYPQIGMRQMSDTDILFDAVRAEDVKSLMESLGYEVIHFGTGHQDDYQKKPLFHFEMHRMLFSEERRDCLYHYYKDVEKRLLHGEGYRRQFSPEDFYLYLIAHIYKHYYWKGIGLRSLLDLYVFLNRYRDSLNWDYLHQELEKMQLEEFERRSRDLAERVFRRGDTLLLSPEEEKLLNVFAESGMYGTWEGNIRSHVEREGRTRYLLERIFLPLPDVQRFYPFFYQHKVLLPLLPLYRLAKERKKAVKEWKAFRKIR